MFWRVSKGGTRPRRALHQLIERAETRPSEHAPTVESQIPNEPLTPVHPVVDSVIPEAVLASATTPDDQTHTKAAAEATESTPTPAATVPDISDVFTPDDAPASSPLDAPPSPGTTQIGKPVPLTFEDANHEGGGRTVVPNTDAGTSIEEELDEEDDKPTVLYTKGLFDDALQEPTVTTPSAPPVVTKDASRHPIPVNPLRLPNTPWLVLVAGVILLVYTLVNVF